MKKLNLVLESLAVESFSTDSGPALQGTVVGQQVHTVDHPIGNNCRNTWADWTCEDSCGATCIYANTCGAPSCQSCVGTCFPCGGGTGCITYLGQASCAQTIQSISE